jgi:PAS domain-containing protein
MQTQTFSRQNPASGYLDVEQETTRLNEQRARGRKNGAPIEFARGDRTDPHLSELRLAALAETEMRSIYPCEVVKVEDGVLTVDVDAPLLWEDGLVEQYNERARRIAGVKSVRVRILPSSVYGLG